MKNWRIGILAMTICWYCLTPATAGTLITGPGFGESGFWADPTVSDLCEDTQRCVVWHDDTDPGGFSPTTLCCVEESRISDNQFADCERPFFWFPR